MDLQSSTAVKTLNKHSAHLCLLYLLLLGVTGIGFLSVAISKLQVEFASFLFGAVVGVGCLIGAGFFLKMLITKNYGPYIQEYFTEHPETTIAELDKDFAEAERIINNLWIGTKCTFHMGYFFPHIIENKDLIWVYLTKVSGQGGGSWRVNFCDKNKKMTSFTLKSKKKAERIAEIYNQKFNHLVVGYSEELERLYNQEDLTDFLNIKYSQNV